MKACVVGVGAVADVEVDQHAQDEAEDRVNEESDLAANSTRMVVMRASASS